MSDITKKIAIFNQKIPNIPNNNSHNNNNINKKTENKANEEFRKTLKNELIKIDEKKNTRATSNNNISHNPNSNHSNNTNDNNQKNKFQNKISVYEKSFESKPSFNKDNKKFEIKKKENESKEKNKQSNNKNNETKISTADKIHFYNTGGSKKSETKTIHDKNNIENNLNRKESNTKLSTADKINNFNNNKKEEPKINSFSTIKKEEPKINSFSINKKEEPKISSFSINKKEEEPKALTDRINMFNKNKTFNEQKIIPKEKNDIKTIKNENEAKTNFFDRINKFNNNNNVNKKEKESEQKIVANKNTISNNNKNASSVKDMINQINNNKNDKKEDDKEINDNIRKAQTITDANNIFKKLNLSNDSNTNTNANANAINNNTTKNNSNTIFNKTKTINIQSNINNNLNINQEEETISESNNTPKASNKNNLYNSPSTTLRTASTFSNLSNFSNFSNNQNEFDEIGEIFLNSESIKESVVNNAFCMGFFITSFNMDNPQLIENTTELDSDCGHNLCTNSLAIKPEIIFRYPQKDTNDFEISELGASICFPNGIKICYAKNENHVRALKNYSSILTNQVGKRYYMITYHYYLKIRNDEFNTNNDYFSSLDDQLVENFNTCEYIYIPYCLALLTKYPYCSQVDKCLESLRFTLENYDRNPSEIYDLIIYYLKSIPVPPIGSKLFFPIPYYSDLISINHPFYKDIILFGDNPVILLEYLTADEITILFRLLLFEQKIIIVGNNYDHISQLTYNFILLLYPLQWVHTYISILTEKMVKYLQSFLPFFFGMHLSLYELTANILESIKENIFIYDLNKHTFEMNTFPNLNTKNIIKKINEIVPQLPKNIYNNMTFGLGILKSYYDKKKDQRNFNLNNIEEMAPLNTKIKQVFIQTFLEILYDYKNFLSMINNKPIFNTNGLVEKRPKNESSFYKELTETQLFQMFIQNNPVNVSKNNETFFEEQLEIYLNLKSKTDFREAYINNSSILCDIYKHYIIKLDTFEHNSSDNSNKNYIENNEEETLYTYKKKMKQKNSQYDIYFKPNVIMKVNKRVITNKVVLEMEKIPGKYNFYIIPNQEFNFEELKRKKSIRGPPIVTNSDNSNKKNNQKKAKGLSPDQMDDIKENIVDILTKIFKNEEISDIQESKALIMDSIKTDYGKDLYINILYQNNNISNESSFQFLKDIIYKSIIQIPKNISKDAPNLVYYVKLMKCCNNFRKKDNKKFIYLSDALFPKLKKIQILEDLKFWENWGILEIEDQSKDNIGEDEKWVISLDNIKNAMIKIGFNKTLIYSIVANLAKNNIKEETIFLKYMRKVVEELQIFKM